MRINSNTCLLGDKVVLVPYRREHVPVYHAWMKDPFLQEATGSEPLSLEQEYAMQRSWAEDESKCTFIVLDCSALDTPGCGSHGGGMAGDVNLYFNDVEDTQAAEIEVMIAEPNSRGRGLGKEASMLTMAYAVAVLCVTSFRAKINYNNTPSLGLFAKLGYVEVSRSEVFRQVTLQLVIDDNCRNKFLETWADIKSSAYDATT
eukprot:jgi/Chlat1/9034/Chrsp94S08304